MDNPTTTQYASLMHNFILKARSTVREIDPQNDLTFLRIRSKKNEIMVAPDKDYFLIVIQNPSEWIIFWLTASFLNLMLPQLDNHVNRLALGDQLKSHSHQWPSIAVAPPAQQCQHPCILEGFPLLIQVSSRTCKKPVPYILLIFSVFCFSLTKNNPVLTCCVSLNTRLKKCFSSCLITWSTGHADVSQRPAPHRTCDYTCWAKPGL